MPDNEPNNDIYVMIAIPSKGEMMTRTVECLISTLGHCIQNRIRVKVTFAEGTLVTHVRNKLVEEFLKAPHYTHLFFIDSDMVFNPEWLEKLLKHDKDMICGIARTRGDICYNVYEKHEPTGKYRPLGTLEGAAPLMEIDATGMAFMLMKRKVVALVREFNSVGEKSEDMLFCEKAKEMGFKIFCDTDVRLGHLVNVELKCNK